MNDPTAATDGDTVLAKVDVPMSPRRVFAALTTDEVERWWGSPDVYLIRNWRADVRVGGRWSLDVCLPNGTILPATGEYLVVRIPEKIVQTRLYKFDHPTLGRKVTTVTYQIERIPYGAHLTVQHDGFDGIRAAADEHAAGWERFLGWLSDYASLEANKTLNVHRR
jgi:uncharacterized protein YndB with AHSA1/START domain